ncbi:MAG: hypothetical protein ACE5FA_03045 [Dehalococcoidia bacterium]
MNRFRSETDAPSRKRPRLAIAAVLFTLALTAFAVACGGGDSGTDTSPNADPDNDSPTVSPATGTPAPPDPELARSVFDQFVEAVQDNKIEEAWGLFIASIPGGDVQQHNEDLGCQFVAFGDEFPRMQHMFERIAPFELVEAFGNAGANLFIELKLRGADGNDYLARLEREPAHASYRVQSFNIGRPSLQPGVPDPFPSPEDPRGFCAIWTGSR